MQHSRTVDVPPLWVSDIAYRPTHEDYRPDRIILLLRHAHTLHNRSAWDWIRQSSSSRPFVRLASFRPSIYKVHHAGGVVKNILRNF